MRIADIPCSMSSGLELQLSGARQRKEGALKGLEFRVDKGLGF